jgi:hypothetical protein
MKLSEFKEHLMTSNELEFLLPSGKHVPGHFHVTELGHITKNFIDCGGKSRHEEVVNFQLLDADDTDHQLKPLKLMKIIELSEKVLDLGNHELEVEYQSDTIGKYGVEYIDGQFHLTSKSTACLANDNCGTKSEPAEPTCTPDGGCC